MTMVMDAVARQMSKALDSTVTRAMIAFEQTHSTPWQCWELFHKGLFYRGDANVFDSLNSGQLSTLLE